MLSSLISRFGPEHLGLVLIDPKQVEFPRYGGIPHLLAPVADDVDSALDRLRALVAMMEGRYTILQTFGARSLPELNVELAAAGHKRYPYVVCVIDELADLMMAARQQCESLVVRIAQKARAVGIHLVLATQSPRHQVVTGLLSANIPTRIAFSVATQVDSRVILGTNGAELLLGNGDGLLSLGGARPIRFAGALAESAEIEAICDLWREEAR
jgi:S-DNA-T family DNA segregation ATPase FtsK/SpoIIIE